MKPLRVCIDSTPLLLRSAGVKTYVYYWVQALRKLAGNEAVPLFPVLQDIGVCVHERSILPWTPTMARLALLHFANYCPLSVLDPIGTRVDVFHASHQLLHPPRNCPVTATLYDMTCWLLPEMHHPANVAMARKFADRVIRRAAGLIAISEATKNDAVRLLDLDPGKVQVIYPGVSEAFFSATPAVRAKPYLLYVGTIEPRKNVATLVDAFLQLPPALRDRYELVLAGSPGWGDLSIVDRLRSGIPGIHYLGYVPETDLPGLTAGASVFVYPSLWEGFGLPLAQAMAAGVPAITSQSSCLPEVAGGGALTVDPRSPAELSAAITRLLESESLRRDLAEAGKAKAAEYRWNVCAERSWQFFSSLFG